MLNLLQTGQRSLHNIWMLGDRARALTHRLTASGLVTDKPCLLLECGVSFVTADEYVSPTDHWDHYGDWGSEEKTYDDLIGYFATSLIAGLSWNGYLHLYLPSAVLCSGLRFFARDVGLVNFFIDVAYWDGSVWVDVYEGGYPDAIWEYKDFPDLAVTDELRFRFYNRNVTSRSLKLHEVDFTYRRILDVTIYDGFNNTGEAKHRIVLSSTGSDFKRFEQPVYFANGLYVEFAESVGECFIRYKELGCL